MKITIIRHAEPDNPNNTLTPRGFIEAEALGKHHSAKEFDEVYCSSLPRARLTCDALIKGEKEAHVVDWLREFTHPFIDEDGEEHHNWDFLPSYIEKHPEIVFDEGYLESPLLSTASMKKEYDHVVSEFDKVLARHGYYRKGRFYQVEEANTKNIAFVCHFGMMSVLLSHIMGVPYTLLAQFTCCQPTGITTLVSEEREKGKAQFRMLEYGNVAHLAKENLIPSFHGRFCEIYDSEDRH